MNRRMWTIFFPVWALLVLPALCTAGVMTHPCAPHEPNQPAHQSHGEDENGCPHESDCSQDPCSGLNVRNEGQDSYAQVFTAQVVFLAEPSLTNGEADSCDFLHTVRFANLTLPKLPCPESILPLLI